MITVALRVVSKSGVIVAWLDDQLGSDAEVVATFSKKEMTGSIKSGLMEREKTKQTRESGRREECRMCFYLNVESGKANRGIVTRKRRLSAPRQ